MATESCTRPSPRQDPRVSQLRRAGGAGWQPGV